MVRFQRDHLETLVAAVDEGTFDAAAAALRITPSAVSQRVKAMEQLTGRVLLQRSTPVRPTADGEVVLRHARQAQLLDDETSRSLGVTSGDGGHDDGDPGTAAAGLVVPSVTLAVNSDSLGSWFLDALDLARARVAETGGDVVFDLHREDQERTASLLRAGSVMAAVTAEREPVQGCSSEFLGVMRYLPVAATSFIERYPDVGVARDPGAAPARSDGSDVNRVLDALDRVPLVDYDRADDLQQGFLRALVGRAPRGPRHFIPTSHEYDEAVRRGYGWGLVPEEQCRADLDAGRMVVLLPGRHADVGLWWQRWNLASTLLDTVTDAVRTVAASRLRQP
jgi:LysR family transcriptional regulator, chromosome initiation inhibitor